MSADRRTLIEAARRAAREAGAAILEIYSGDFDVRRKSDRTPVTLADERAEAIIIAALAKSAPDIAVIAEEQMSAGGDSGPAPQRFWVVDPLDGTREFIRRNGEFTVNIGLVEGNEPVLGVVHLPVTNVTYAGGVGIGATRQQGDAPPEAIAARRAPGIGAIVAHSRSHSNEERLKSYLAGLQQAQTLIMGSAAKFCVLAAGEADHYPRFGTTMEWDTAAGQAVLEAAGGSVTTLDGARLLYAKPAYCNTDFIARGRPD